MFSRFALSVQDYAEYGLFSQCWPGYYNSGSGDFLDTDRMQVFTNKFQDLAAYGKYLHFHHRGTYQQAAGWKFHLFSTIERWKAVALTGLFVKMHKGESCLSLTALTESFRQGAVNGAGKELHGKLMTFGRTIRGTEAYWRAHRKFLVSFMKQIRWRESRGCAFFVTFSMSAFTDEIFMARLACFLGQDELEFRNRSKSDKYAQVHKHSVLLSEYWHEYATALIQDLIRVLFQGAHHWFRFEWAGAPHVHGFVIPQMTAPQLGPGVLDGLDAMGLQRAAEGKIKSYCCGPDLGSCEIMRRKIEDFYTTFVSAWNGSRDDNGQLTELHIRRTAVEEIAGNDFRVWTPAVEIEANGLPIEDRYGRKADTPLQKVNVTHFSDLKFRWPGATVSGRMSNLQDAGVSSISEGSLADQSAAMFVDQWMSHCYWVSETKIRHSKHINCGRNIPDHMLNQVKKGTVHGLFPCRTRLPGSTDMYCRFFF